MAIDSTGDIIGQIELPASAGAVPRRAVAFAGDRVLVLHRDVEGEAWFEVYRFVVPAPRREE